MDFSEETERKGILVVIGNRIGKGEGHPRLLCEMQSSTKTKNKGEDKKISWSEGWLCNPKMA